MQWIPVLSTTIARIAYENSVLTIAFKDGSIYSYVGVPIQVFEGFRAAQSHGKFYVSHIKGKYPSNRIL